MGGGKGERQGGGRWGALFRFSKPKNFYSFSLAPSLTFMHPAKVPNGEWVVGCWVFIKPILTFKFLDPFLLKSRGDADHS